MGKKTTENYRQQALKLFQLLRRLEESENGYAQCISCGKILPVHKLQGGHFITRKCRATEMDKDNVWPQCAYCNGFQYGNIVRYRMNLVDKIGKERVERLENLYLASLGSDEAREKLDPCDLELLGKKHSADYMVDIKFLKKRIEHFKD